MSKKAFTPAMDCTHEERPVVALRPIESNKLQAIGYCPDHHILAAQFAPSGSIYHYENFSQEQWDAFQAAESKGKHFGEHIQILPSKKYAPEPAAVLTS